MYVHEHSHTHIKEEDDKEDNCLRDVEQKAR